MVDDRDWDFTVIRETPGERPLLVGAVIRETVDVADFNEQGVPIIPSIEPG